MRTSRLLRRLLSWPFTRPLVRWALVALREVACRTGVVRALDSNAATRWLGQALCVAVVLSAALQLAASR